MTGWWRRPRSRISAHRPSTTGRRALGLASAVTALVLGLAALTPAADSAGRPAAGTARVSHNSTLARRLAREVDRASSPGAEYAALIKVMRALYIGVYTPQGRRVLRGGETGPRDLYLYNFELRAMAASLLNHDVYTPDDIAALLTSVGINIGGGPVPPSVIAALLPQWMKVARSDPRSSSSLLPLLVEDLGLGSSPRRDLSRGSTIRLDALQTFLIDADILGPALREASASGRHTIHAAADGGCPKLEFGPPSQEEKANEQIKDRVDNGLEKAAKELAGKEAAELIEKAGNWKKLAGHIIDGLHGSIIGFSLKVDDVTSASKSNGHYATAYGPIGNGALGGQPINFQVKVYMRDDIGGGLVDCLALYGIKIPPKGPIKGIPILWNARVVGNLERHGTFTPAVSKLLGTATSTTDENGIATLVFTPRDEVLPGLGLFKHDDGLIDGTALWANATGNKLGKIAQLIAPVHDSMPWDVGYHDQAGDLEFDSTMVDTPSPGGQAQESGNATYQMTALVHFSGQDPATTTGPLGPALPASAPLTHVAVSGVLSKSGQETCNQSNTGGPYSLTETPRDFTDGSLQLLDASLAPGSTGPGGLMLHILPSAQPLELMTVDFRGACGDSIHTTYQFPIWGNRFFLAHQSEIPSGDNCQSVLGAVCSYELSGWQPGSGNTYATKEYIQHISYAETCDVLGYSCIVLDLDEHTTISLLQSQ